MKTLTNTQICHRHYRGVLEDPAATAEMKHAAAKVLLSHANTTARSRKTIKDLKAGLEKSKARIRELEQELELRPALPKAEPERELPMVGIN